MKVGENDMGDPHAVVRRERHVLIDVTLRIDHGGQAAPLVAHEVRGVRQAVQIELSQDHWRTRFLIADYERGWGTILI